MNMPGFTADASLYQSNDHYVAADRSSPVGGMVVPQFRDQSDPDLGAYLRCRANGGGDLICRFFAGLPPFTIGVFSR